MTNALMAHTHQNHTTTGKPVTRRVKFGQLLRSSDPNFLSPLLNVLENDDVNNSSGSGGSENSSCRLSNASDYTGSPRPSNSYTDENPTSSPFYYAVSPWNQTTSSPYIKSPWIKISQNSDDNNNNSAYYSRGRNCLIGSLVREEGHVYSLAVRGGVLYTGSESKNIRVWRNFHDVGGFKCGSGLVKAIVVSSNQGNKVKVFTGHQDGKIRVWTETGKRVGTLPKLGDYLRSSINPKNYVEVRRHHKVPRIKHYDAVSCLSLNEEAGLLYSGSWDKTIKVWRVKDGKCLETFEAHDDAINSIVVGFDGLVFSGSADGSVKVWRRELQGRITGHIHVKTLLEQENAVTSLAVTDGGDEGGDMGVLYCGSSDGLVNFWVREKEEVVYGGVLRGHKLAVLCLGVAGCLVLSGSADKSICVWRREGGGGGGDAGVHSCLAVLTGHSGPVKCLAVEQVHHHHHHHHDHDDHDQRWRQWIVYSGSLDKSVRIWKVSEHTSDEEE